MIVAKALKNNISNENTTEIQLLPCFRTILPPKISRNEIMTSNVAYETAHGVLSQGINEVSLRVLGFLSASLCAAERADGSAPTQGCAARARELLRRSGCLKDMLEMFLGTTTMTNEYWKVLCQCLVESCRYCEDNQNYCSCLIPACVRRCEDVMDIEILKLLHCLLLNNITNINLFVECNGTHMFTKETIHDSFKLELLSIVVQNSSAANLLKSDRQLLNSLITVEEDYKVNCEGSWKMVEWASVILFHLATHIEGADNSMAKISNITTLDHEMNNSKSNLNDLTVSFLFKLNWEKVEHVNVFKDDNIQNKITDQKLKCSNTSILRGFCFKPLNENHMSFRSSTIDFVPTYVSTPKRRITTTNEERAAKINKKLKKSTMLKSNTISQHEARGKEPASIIKKPLSTSACFFNIVNNSCISIYNTMGAILGRKQAGTQYQSVLKQTSQINDGPVNNFSKHMKRIFIQPDIKVRGNFNPQKQTNGKLAIRQKYRQGIVKKLKTGMYFYGCNFKKISQAMWAHERQMTPKILYSIYKQCIVK